MIKIVEVGPRDGLQNETVTIPAETKVAFVDALSESGVSEIEVSAFVSEKMVPQLKDAATVFQNILRRKGVVYSALIPNTKGLERAVAAGANKISVFTAASETFNRKNINTTVAGSLERIAVHFHDTYGRGVANVLKSVSYGIRTVDASVGGLGGCPFAPGATGNVATESVVTELIKAGEKVTVQIDKLNRAYGLIAPYLTTKRLKKEFN